MSILGKYFKTPIERKLYSIDYTDWLDSGELISNVTFGVTPSSGTPVVVDGNVISPGSKAVIFYAGQGTVGVTYKVDVRMTSSNGQVKEDTIQYTVKSA